MSTDGLHGQPGGNNRRMRKEDQLTQEVASLEPLPNPRERGGTQFRGCFAEATNELLAVANRATSPLLARPAEASRGATRSIIGTRQRGTYPLHQPTDDSAHPARLHNHLRRSFNADTVKT